MEIDTSLTLNNTGTTTTDISEGEFFNNNNEVRDKQNLLYII